MVRHQHTSGYAISYIMFQIPWLFETIGSKLCSNSVHASYVNVYDFSLWENRIINRKPLSALITAHICQRHIWCGCHRLKQCMF